MLSLFKRAFSSSKNSLKSTDSISITSSISYAESHAKLEALKNNPRYKNLFVNTPPNPVSSSTKPIDPKLIEKALKEADESKKYSVF
jgi:hypothetical protein